MKSIELALSMCDIVDIYGFTVDPGYTEWLVQLLSVLCFMFTSKMLTIESIRMGEQAHELFF